MKLVKIGFALAAACLVMTASAQVTVVPRHSRLAGANPQGTAAVRQDLIVAIRSMESALPIYDGNRVKSIRFAHQALKIVERALYGSKSTLRQPTEARDTVRSQFAKAHYSAAQIQTSQASMNQGYQALVAAQNDLKAAVNNNPGKMGVEIYNLIQQAGSEGEKALALHGGYTVVPPQG